MSDTHKVLTILILVVLVFVLLELILWLCSMCYY